MKLGLKMVELLLICMLSLLNITNIFIFHWLIRISVVLSKTLQISISCRNESNFGRNKEKTRLWFVKRGAYPKKFRNSKIRIKLRLTLRNQKKKGINILCSTTKTDLALSLLLLYLFLNLSTV